jgi:hypothetical protein
MKLTTSQDGFLFVHFFDLNFPGANDFHGLVIGPERFRGPERWRPNIQLIWYHYNQCLMAHFRGFSVGFG